MSSEKSTAGGGTSARTAIFVLVGISILSIWASVVLSSIYAPALVSGSQQEQLPLVGWTEWLWGLLATAFVVLAAIHGMRANATERRTPWIWLAVGVSAVWIGVFVVTVAAPVFVTGSDPTRVPVFALIAPVVGVFLTWFVCSLVRMSFGQSS